MKTNKKIRDELKKIAPFLSDLKKEEGFKVPKNYFSNLSEEVFAKIKEEEQIEESINPISNTNWINNIINNFILLLQPRLIAGLATVVVLVIAGLFQMNKQTGIGKTPYLSELSMEELQNYLNENIDELDDELLIELSATEQDFFLSQPNELNDEDIENLIDDLDSETLEELL